MTLNKYFLGIDVGGTKTHALISDGDGGVCGFGQAGPGNHEVVGYDGLSKAMQIATDRAMKQAGIVPSQIVSAGFGLSGYDWESELPPTVEAIKPLNLDAPFKVVNDSMIGLIAGAKEGWGVAVVAGTGCNAWGRNQQNEYGHVTGMGSLMDEGAGASELVEEAIHRISRAWSLRGPATRLTEVFCTLCDVKTSEELIEGITQERIHIGPGAASLVLEIAKAGDPVAVDIVRWAGEGLADLAIGVIKQIGIENDRFEIIQIGSIFDAGALLTDPMGAAIHKVAQGAELIKLTIPPVVGGVLLGMEQVGLATQLIREKLIHSVEERL